MYYLELRKPWESNIALLLYTHHSHIIHIHWGVLLDVLSRLTLTVASQQLRKLFLPIPYSSDAKQCIL
jgi:hypothetical protein